MKSIVLPLALLSVGLSACSHVKINVAPNRADELQTIKRVCVIPNPRRTPYGLEKNLVKALQNHGIEAEAVASQTDKHLYQPECRYNLRYISAGREDTIKKITLILRTPEYQIASIGYSANEDKQYLTSPDLQRQTDGIIGRLFGKTAR